MIRPATAEDVRQLRWETREVDHHGWAEKCREIVRAVKARMDAEDGS